MTVLRKLGYVAVEPRKTVPIKPRKVPVVLFDRQRRIDLLWELFLVSLLALFALVLVLGCVP